MSQCHTMSPAFTQLHILLDSKALEHKRQDWSDKPKRRPCNVTTVTEEVVIHRVPTDTAAQRVVSELWCRQKLQLKKIIIIGRGLETILIHETRKTTNKLYEFFYAWDGIRKKGRLIKGKRHWKENSLWIHYGVTKWPWAEVWVRQMLSQGYGADGEDYGWDGVRKIAGQEKRRGASKKRGKRDRAEEEMQGRHERKKICSLICVQHCSPRLWRRGN